jgi:ribosome-binding protein aMBF1 (putative translation factor)
MQDRIVPDPGSDHQPEDTLPSHTGTAPGPEPDDWHRQVELRALGAAVRELRARRGLSQEALGFRAGVHRNYVGGIERGELNVTFRVLLKLARGLAVSLSELIGIYERNRLT